MYALIAVNYDKRKYVLDIIQEGLASMPQPQQSIQMILSGIWLIDLTSEYIALSTLLGIVDKNNFEAQIAFFSEKPSFLPCSSNH